MVKSMAKFDYKKQTNSEHIVINGFKIAPAEADDLKSAVSFAGGMREFPVLPPSIPYGRFVVTFNEDGTLVVSRDGVLGDIEFSFDTVDQLIVAINDASQVSADQKKLKPAPRATGGLDMFNSGDIIEGRD